MQFALVNGQRCEARESFYRNLIWILDGRSFRKSFHIGCMLPDPASEGFEDIVWSQHARSAYRPSPEPIEYHVPSFWRISESANHYPGLTKANIDAVIPPGGLVQVHSEREIREEVIANYSGYHQFYWTRTRQTWLDAKCPVYIDFGEELLYRLQEYNETFTSPTRHQK